MLYLYARKVRSFSGKKHKTTKQDKFLFIQGAIQRPQHDERRRGRKAAKTIKYTNGSCTRYPLLVRRLRRAGEGSIRAKR